MTTSEIIEAAFTALREHRDEGTLPELEKAWREIQNGEGYTVPQVLANLREMDNQLDGVKPNLDKGAGWVRAQVQNILSRGIAGESGVKI